MAKRASGKKSQKSAKKSGDANVLRAREIGARQKTFSHPWNPNSEISGVELGAALGLTRTGVSIASLAPGKESFALHAHQREEEWIYVLYGQGTAVIGDKEVPVGMGDFLAFPAPQVAHLMRNTGQEHLVYLMGGEKLDHDVVDFPALKRRIVRAGGDHTVYEQSAGKPFSYAPPAAKPAKKQRRKS